MIGPQPPPTHIARRGHKIINWIDPTDKVVFWAPRTEALERKHWTRGWKSMRLTAVHWAVHWDYRVHCKNLQALQMAMPSAWAMLFIWDQLPSEWFQTSCGRGQKHWCLYTYMHACMHAYLLEQVESENPYPTSLADFQGSSQTLQFSIRHEMTHSAVTLQGGPSKSLWSTSAWSWVLRSAAWPLGTLQARSASSQMSLWGDDDFNYRTKTMLGPEGPEPPQGLAGLSWA